MGYTLVIVESPAKCKKIEKFLGKGYKCCASFGHIRSIKDGLKGIDMMNDFTPSFQSLPSKMKYITSLRKNIRGADKVILATDDDREGEAIAWHICDTFKLSIATTPRIIFHEITKPAIQQAVASPTILDMDKVKAQQARQVLDLIVGFRLSPMLWKHVSHTTKSVLSAGRCQTPALRLVYDNQQEINRSPGKKKYNTSGYFTEKNLDFQLSHYYDSQEGMEKFLEESVSFNHKYTCTKPRETTKKQPRPFTTSDLQQKSSNELHFSPKKTMQGAQKLYEGGFITYMRTDSRTYSKEFIQKAKTFIKTEYGNKFIHKQIDILSLAKGASKKKKDSTAQEAHEAIRPTDITRKALPPNMDNREKRLYSLIWKNTVESCMAPALYFSLRAVLTAPQEHKYVYTTELVQFPGWKIVGGYEKSNPIYHFLQEISKESTLSYSKIISKLTLKELKKHYTEARLVKMLEDKGIGRPSTFSSLISKIQDRKYVQKEDIEGKPITCVDFKLIGDELEEIEESRVFGGEKNKLVIQPLGVLVLEFLLKHFDPLFSYKYTKRMEDSLDLIARGEKVWHTLCRDCNGGINILSEKISDNHREMIRIDEHHIYMIGKYGPVIRCDKNDDTSFLSVRNDINLETLKNGGYTLEEIVNKKPPGCLLGKYKGNDVWIKKGKFGMYVSCDGKNASVKHLKKAMGAITLSDVEDVLSGKKSANPNVLRMLRDDLSLRRGKWGPYLFYKTDKMKKPRFLKIKGCELNVMQCAKEELVQWVEREYQV